jgi:DNA-directed RNA polymerase subunit H
LSEKTKETFDVLKHVYVPKHEILPKKEADEILVRYNTKHAQLPFIFLSDPALRDLGAKPGDIIKITRKSPTAGESIYYRYVVEG